MVEVKELNRLIDYYHENRLSHAYLIETNNLELCFEDLKKVVKAINCNDKYTDKCDKCNLCNLLDNNFLPSFIVIEPDGKNIKKEQVLELKSRFNTMPIYTKNNIYIIKEAEKLNSSSANTMLKFIEEPEEQIIGFFITNNINNVINTIKSRCEIISVKYDKEEENILKNEYIEVVKEYISKIELEKKNTIMYNKSVILSNYTEKIDILNILKLMLEIYRKTIIEYNECSDELFKNIFQFLFELDIKELIRKEKKITNFIDDLNYNVNIELFLDRFIIELSDNNG